ncbi:MAG: M56 family metallopeptidase [Myxococcota bacterium]
MEMTALVWILTYAIHSTVLIGSVWVLLKLFPRVPLRLQETLWRVALFGGLLTATVHQAADVTPLGGRLAMPAALQSRAPDVAPALAPSEEVVQRRITQHDAGDVRITTVQQQRTPAVVAAPAPAFVPSRWPWLILGLAGLGGAFALLRLGLGARRTAARLRGRRDVIEDPVLERFFELCDEAGFKGKRRVRLTASAHLRSPVALMRREVVIPERALERLTPAQQHGMVAHELHHLQRRDPQWAMVTAVMEALFVFQPLNHLARRKLQELAEFQCDDWAAQTAGGGTQLAKCLAEVASWLDEARPSALTVAMADRDSPVVRRITRLLHGRRKVRAGSTSPVFRIGTGVVLLGASVWLMPNIAPASSGTSTSTQGDAVPTGAASLATVTVTDLSGESGQRRSAVHIDGAQEHVEVRVDRKPELAPPPPPPPPASDRIVIRGFYSDLFGFGHGCGSVDVEVNLDDFEAEIEGSVGFGFPFSQGCDRREAQARRRHEALERRRDSLERARERLERKRERLERKRERLERRVRPPMPPTPTGEPGVFAL